MSTKKWSSSNIPVQLGKTIIITGTTSGLGKEAARVLAGKQARLILGVRNTGKAAIVKAEILKQYPTARIEIYALDLSDLASIEHFAKEVLTNHDQVDVLINNAGIMMCPFSTTKDGFEIQMGTNHLGTFALTGRLMGILKNTKNSRIVVTSSIAHRQGNIDFNDINWSKRRYNTYKAYSDSKIANLYFAYELAEKLKGSEYPKVIAVHPGYTNTDLQRHSRMFKFLNNFLAQSVETGVLPTLRAATDTNAKSGEFYGPSGLFELRGAPKMVQSNKKSHDKQAQKKLWEISEAMTGVKY